MITSYPKDMRRALGRYAAVPSQKLQTPFGTIEFAVSGAGPAFLFSHGVLGSYLDGLHSAEVWVGSGYRVVAPSRFGYFGSALPSDATLSAQADAHVALLDHLGLERVIAAGFSAGGPSVIELALRNPDRVQALLLLSSRLPGLPKPGHVAKPLLHFVFGADRLFWIYKQLMPKTYALMMGIPKSVNVSAEHAVFDPIAESFFPLRPRRDGAMFDAFVSNPAVDDLPLEDISVPTLIVHASDDPLALYSSAGAAASRIPGVRFETVSSGGHLFLGHDQLVREVVGRFIESIPTHEATSV